MKLPTRFVSSVITLGLVVALAGFSLAGQPATVSADARATDANITRLTTGILGQSQFAHHPLDAELAGRLLDRYLDALDGTHSIFLQSDVDEFAAYRATLAKATLAAGDTTAAHAIFARFLQRQEQQAAYIRDTVRTARFDFSGHDVYGYDRENTPRPKDLKAAREIWRQQLRAEYLQEKLSDKKPEQIVSTLLRRHEQQTRIMKGLRADEVLEIYLNALAHVYDPHSDYLGRQQMESLSIAMNLKLVGIGAALETDDGYCKIRELLPGGPAARSGLLKAGDRIVAVAQDGKPPVDIVNMPLSRAVELIRGQKGSRVSLTILPGPVVESASPKTISLVRDEIKLADQEARARVLDVPTEKGPALRLGVIELPSFYANLDGPSAEGHRSATVDVARLLTKLKAEKVRGVVMDLRRNGGGSLQEAISLTGLFIRKGPVVQTRDQGGRVEIGADEDGKVLYDGPLVLLISRFSASATEILAGALQDYGRAVVVGDSATFGKGTVQSVVGLAPLMDRAGLAHAYDPGALKITISKFYRPSGASTQLRGVASDIVLPSPTDVAEVSESALKDPLPWDVMPSAVYEPVNRVQPHVATLRASSTRRVKSDRDFVYLAGDIDRVAKSLASKSISLNEAERRQELAQAKARQAERERETRTLTGRKPVAHEITLQNVDQPGLPSPVAPAKDADTAAPAESPTDKDEVLSRRRSAGNDAVLDESLRILGDYVDLLSPAKPANRVGAL